MDDEVRLLIRVQNSLVATNAVMIQKAVASLLDKKEGAKFQQAIKGLLDGE